MISLIVAHDRNRLMGVGNALPWSLPSDLKHFQRMTRGQAVIMGRNTFVSLPDAYRPLPGRDNHVVSRTIAPERDGRLYVHPSIEQAIDAADGNAWIIGGAQIYASALAMDIVDQMVITEIDEQWFGDVYFPAFDIDLYPETGRVHVGEDNFPYDIVTYTRTKREIGINTDGE